MLAYEYIPHLCLVPKETKRALDALELELQTTVSCHVRAGNLIQVLCMSSNCS